MVWGCCHAHLVYYSGSLRPYLILWCNDSVIEVLRALGFSSFASTVSVPVSVFFTGDLDDSKIDALGLSLLTASDTSHLGQVLVY